VPAKRGLPSTLKMRHDRHYVEELSSLRGAPVGRMILIDRLEPNPLQPG
jgi:ParB family chromosome partitioning protein